MKLHARASESLDSESLDANTRSAPTGASRGSRHRSSRSPISARIALCDPQTRRRRVFCDLACTSDRRRPEIRTCRYNDVSITIGLQLDQETLSMELHYPGGVRAFACAFAAPEVGAGAGIRHACGS